MIIINSVVLIHSLDWTAVMTLSFTFGSIRGIVDVNILGVLPGNKGNKGNKGNQVTKKLFQFVA